MRQFVCSRHKLTESDICAKYGAGITASTCLRQIFLVDCVQTNSGLLNRPDESNFAGISQSDSIGQLVMNQGSAPLGGVQQLSFGLNQLTGDTGSSPLFKLQFCDDQRKTISDPYRYIPI